MSVRSDLQLLQQIPIFAGVDPAYLQAMIFSAEKIVFSAGDLVIRQNEHSAAAFLVVSGSGDVISGNLENPQIIGRVERGAFIGELSMIADIAYSVSVSARSRMLTLKLSHKLFMRVCSEFPKTGEQVLSALTSKLDINLDSLRDVKKHFEQARSFVDL